MNPSQCGEKYKMSKRENNSFAFEAENLMGDVVYIVNSDGMIENANKMCERILGISQEEIIGRTVDELWDMGIFEKEYNFFIGYEARQAYELVDSLRNKEITEMLVNESPKLSYFAMEKKRTVSGITKIKTTDKIVLIVCKPVFKTLCHGEKTVDYVITTIRDLTVIIDLKNKIQKIQDSIERGRNQSPKEVFIGNSKAAERIRYMINEMAYNDVSVLITGDTGVGKEVVAKEIHYRGKRKEHPYVCVNCAAIPDSLFESEFFGYEKGSFTGALNKRKIGMFEKASGGTLFLDEIEALQLSMQAKLLRTLQEKTIRRIGGVEEIKCDVRILAASNKDMLEMIKNGQFREDLYYRLNIISIKIPSLRERKEDILPLTEVFLQKFNEKYDKTKYLKESAIKALEEYNWPGNVRDLEHTIERLVVIGDKAAITGNDVKYAVEDNVCYIPNEIVKLEEAVNRTEKALIEDAIKIYGSSRKVANALGVSQPTILRKCKKLGIALGEE